MRQEAVQRSREETCCGEAGLLDRKPQAGYLNDRNKFCAVLEDGKCKIEALADPTLVRALLFNAVTPQLGFHPTSTSGEHKHSICNKTLNRTGGDKK